MELTRSQRFIRDNARTMRSATEYFNLDTNLMTMEDYEKATLRLLVVFPSPATTKSVSMTASVLNDFVISECPGVFIDFAFVPEQDDLSTFDKFMMPYAIGNITGLDASHYDLVGFSISILFEAMTTAMIVNSFNRCDRPIPLTWSERKDHKFGETPALYLGGITASVTDVLFGDVGDGRQAFVDFIHLGEFHCVKDFFDHCIESKKLGRTVQENLDTFWPLSPDHNWLYQPQAYKVTYNDRNQIVSNIKINPNAPDMCQPYYPDEIPHLNGAARGIIQGNGGNAGLGQFMAANGCSRSGFCNFSVAKGTLVASEGGLVPIEQLEACGSIRLQSAGIVTAKDVERQKSERVYRVVLESGCFLDCSLNHKWVRAVDKGKDKRYTTRQIRNILSKSEEFIVFRKIGNHFCLTPRYNLVRSLIRASKKIKAAGLSTEIDGVVWTSKGFRYRTTLLYSSSAALVNNYLTDLNISGFDTSLEVTQSGLAVIYFWPVMDSVVQDKVKAVVKLDYVEDMFDVVETDDHTVCYNSVVTSNCFAKGTLVTTDKGLVRIENIKVGDRVFNGHGMFEEVTAVYVNGKKDGLKFVLDDGNELTVTEDHDLLDEFERVKFAKDFKVGDLLCFRTFDVDSGKTPEYDYRWLYLAGYLLGDGSLYLRDSTPTEARWFFSRSSQGTCNFNTVSRFLSDVGVPFKVDDNPKNTTVRIVIRDRESLLKLYMLIGDKESLTDEVLSLNCNSFLWFLSGVIASDGTVLKQGSIQMGMSRKELILDIYRKAQQFGMATKVNIGHYRQSASDNPRFQKYEGRSISKYRILFTQLDNIRFTPEQIASFGEGKSERVRFPSRQIYRRSKGKIVRIERVSGIETYNLTVSPNHKLLVQGNILSEQCHEGAFTGGWVENTPDRLVELAKIARRYTAATTLKAYSYNSNYLSDYKRSIYDWMSIFPRVTFNNMRLEELGLDPDALKMMKLSGYKRMTAPLEGVSQRVRNNFLNKNLSEKAIDAYLTYGMMMGAVECKIGIVLTGFEEDQDWQEFFDFNEKWQKKAREMGGKIPFRYNMTYLVHYPHTPAEYWERRSVRTALYGGFLMPYKWNKKMTDNKIRIKINGFKHSTLIEQALVDLGRELTSWLYQYLIKPGYPIYSFKPVVNRKEAWEELVSRINIDYFFNERKFDEYISVSHRIHIALHANVILQAMRTLQGGLNAQQTIRCLKTYDGCPVECKANAFARNPLITYGDAWINDKGKLEGVVWEEVKGCQRCKTVEDRKKILMRTLPKSKTANDILSFKAPALRLRLRFRVERNEPYDILSPRNTAFSSLSMFLKESQELTDMFWELENNYNMYWQSEKEYFYTASGQLVYDVTFRDRKAKEIVESLIETVNAKAKTLRVIAVSEVPIDSQIKPTDLNVFYFESTIPAELWQYASMMYKGEVKAEDESGMMATKTDSSLRPPQFTLEDKVKGYFVLPCRYSPWCYLQGLMSSKRVALRKLLKTTKVRCLTTVRETNISCVCGKENAVVDMATGLYKPVGLDCLVNWFTNNIKK